MEHEKDNMVDFFSGYKSVGDIMLRVKIENRDRKISSVLDGCDWVEKKLLDDKEFCELMEKFAR